MGSHFGKTQCKLNFDEVHGREEKFILSEVEGIPCRLTGLFFIEPQILASNICAKLVKFKLIIERASRIRTDG